MVKEKDIQIQKAQRLPKNMNRKKPTPRHIIIKMAKDKDKERNLKATKEKQLLTREHPLNCWLISQQVHFRQEGTGKKYSK